VESRLLKKDPAMDEMRFLYVRLRSKGKSREDSLRELLQEETRLSLPYEQWLKRIIAIGDAMAKNRELYPAAANLIVSSFSELLLRHPKMEISLKRDMDTILRTENFGTAAQYPHWEEYRPLWQQGDVFAFPLSGYFPRLFSLEGKLALLYSAGERQNEEGYSEELVYLSICEPEHIPQSMEELNSLGFLPAFTVFKEYQYLCALRLRRELEAETLGLRKIGHFPGEPRLFRERPDPTRNALCVFPAYDGRDRITLVRALCASYQHFGMIANREQADEAKREWNYGAECREEKGAAPGSVFMEKMPLEKLCSRTCFRHHSTFRERIPNHNTMQAED